MSSRIYSRTRWFAGDPSAWVTRMYRMSAATTVPASTDRTDRLDAIEREIFALRGDRRAPSEPPPALSPRSSTRVLGLLAECALDHAMAGELDEARRAIGDAAPLFHEMPEGREAARAALFIGEACILLDAPNHAAPRLRAALATFEILGDRPAIARTRASLGRALVMLDDRTGIAMLDAACTLFAQLGDERRMSAIATEREAAEAALENEEPPSSIRAGYARPITSFPPAP